MKPKVVFKDYSPNQIVLFPERLDKYIPQDHPARLLSAIVDSLDITSIMDTYKGGGTSSYHPRMMIKILFYAYLNNIYSSRKIANALKQDIVFMWLSGKQFPDFRTINDFRSKRLKGQIQDLFRRVVDILAELGVIDIKTEAYIDGTKIEANANRYTFVWEKSVRYYKGKLEDKLRVILQEIEAQIRDDSQYTSLEEYDYSNLDVEKLRARIDELNRYLNQSHSGEKKKAK